MTPGTLFEVFHLSDLLAVASHTGDGNMFSGQGEGGLVVVKLFSTHHELFALPVAGVMAGRALLPQFPFVGIGMAVGAFLERLRVPGLLRVAVITTDLVVCPRQTIASLAIVAELRF